MQSNEEIASKNMRIEVNDWLRFVIVMDANVIKVSLMRGVAKTTSELFSLQDDSIQRGKVGVGITGMSEVYFHALAT